MLNIYFGRESLDKEKFIFDNLTDKTIILVPDQYTLEAERQAFRHLGVSALMDVEILYELFDGYLKACRVLEKSPMNRIIHLFKLNDLWKTTLRR